MNVPAENAIQQDALEQSDNDAGATNDQESAQLSPRLTAMEAIVAQRQATLAAEGVDTSGMQPEHRNEDDEGAGDDPPPEVDQLAAQLSADDRPTVAGNDNTLVKVKIEGEEIELPLAEVIKSYQKDQTASRRLTEATRLLQLAEQQASKVAHNASQANNLPVTDVPGDQPVQSDDVASKRAKIKGAFSKLYEGDEDAAVDELMSVIGEGVATPTTLQPIDPTAIAAQVKQQLAVESAYGEVQSDYPALFASDDRGVVLGSEVVRRMEAKTSAGISQAKALRESAEEVAALFGVEKAGRQTTVPTSTARDTKLTRKAALDFPSAASVVSGGMQSPAEAPNVSAVIQEMANQRLGQSLVKR